MDEKVAGNGLKVVKNDEKETRIVEIRDLRAGKEGEKPKISGYAAVFNSMSEDLGGFVEQIQPGAFAKTLLEGDQRALWNHDSNIVLGRRKAGSLELGEDEVGLRFAIYPPETQAGRDALALITRGDVDQMSFSFQVVRDDWANLEGKILRTLKEVKLLEISPVAFPAYPQTSAMVRSMVESLKVGKLLSADSGSGLNGLPNEFTRAQSAVEVTNPAAPVEDGQAPASDDHPAGEAEALERIRLLKRKIETLLKI